MAQTGREAPLSFGAEQLLAALDRTVDGKAVSAARWLSALLDQDRELAGRAAEGHDLAALEAAARAAPTIGAEVARLARSDIAALAGGWAASTGRGVASTTDVATAILTAQAPVVPTPIAPPAGRPTEVATSTVAGPRREFEVSLSFGAERLIGSLIPADGERGLWDLLVVLVDDHADVVERAGVDRVSRDSWALRARDLLADDDHGAQWTRCRLATTASAHAGGEHRAVATPADVARSVLESVRATLDPELSDVRGSIDVLGDPGHGAVRTTAAGAASRVSVGTRALSPPAGPVGGPGAGARVVRVFVSSTFRDMGAERDELVKWTFPALRRLCESRGVTWGEVDLRWGVTDEQKAEGQVLPICLAEIRGCRPYFLGLMGERYGWVPDALDPAVIEQEPWISEHAGRSVTELEILHGVLNDPSMADHAFFYLRDPAYVEGKPPERYREVPAPEEIASVGPQEAERRAGERQAKLADLKERVRASGLPVREDYPDPLALGALVLADLSAVIDRLYPAGSEPNPLEREAAEHEAFAHSRGGVYIGRRDYFDRLDAHAASDDPPLVVVGESGSGKSALLSNWVLRHRAANPDDVVLLHFIGASPASTDWTAMVRRIVGELSRRLGFEMEIPEKPDALRLAFANTLHMAAARGRVVLVLDALDQLEDREGALDLTWIPPAVPANVRLVLSTLPGRSLAEIERRAYPTLAIAPLEPAERERLVVDYLASYSRALDLAPRQRIASSPQCANPLYLRALLDELRMWGEHETLPAGIEYYLAAPTVDSLHELILERYETDYERDRPHLVRDAFSLLWAARHGLSETELLDLLGADGEPLPRAHWSPLFLAAESALTSRSGLLGFFHDYLRAAVEHRYLRDERAKGAAHLRLADYFAAREVGSRKIDELPWQLAEAGSWAGLKALLADVGFFARAWRRDECEIEAAWARVAAQSPVRLADAYRIAFEDDDLDWDVVWDIDTLLGGTGELDAAAQLAERLSDRARHAGDQAALAKALARRADLLSLRWQGQSSAMDLQREVERLCRDTGDRAGLCVSLVSQTALLLAGTLAGSYTASEVLRRCDDAHELCVEVGYDSGRARVLLHRAQALSLQGKPAEAQVALAESERISRSIGDRLMTAFALGARAKIVREAGHLDAAAGLIDEAIDVCRSIGDRAGLKGLLLARAQVHSQAGELVPGILALAESEQLCDSLGDTQQLHVVGAARAQLLGDHGVELVRAGRHAEALAALEEAQELAVSHGDANLAGRIEPLLRALRQ